MRAWLMRRLGGVCAIPGCNAAWGAAALSGVLLAWRSRRSTSACSRSWRSSPPSWAWRGRHAGARRSVRLFGVVFAGILLYWLWYFRIVAIVPLVAGWAAYTALDRDLVGCLIPAGLRSPWLIAAAWVVPEALRGRWPFGGCRGATSAWRSTSHPRRGELGRCRARLVRARRVQRVSRRAGRCAPRPGARSIVVATAGIGVVVVLVAGADLALPDPSLGRAAGRRAPGQRPGPLPDHRRKRSGYLPSSTSRSQNSRGQRSTWSCSPNRRSTNSARRATRASAAAWSRWGPSTARTCSANADVPAPDGPEYNQNVLYAPDGRLTGTYSRSISSRSAVRAVPVARRLDRDRRPDPVRLHAGGERTIFGVKGHRLATVICFESAFGPLVRDFVDRRRGRRSERPTTRSYRRSGNSAQHIAQTQMRAAETGRPFVQASISGMRRSSTPTATCELDRGCSSGPSSPIRSRRPPADAVRAVRGWVVAVARCCLWGPRS